jgi:putative hydrolase of the HAD superfamily
MRAVLVPHSAIPENQKGHVEGDPDAVVQRLSELLPVVEAWAAGH